VEKVKWKTEKTGLLLISVAVLLLAASCSKEISTYDELAGAGKVEQLARKKYTPFFKAMNRLVTTPDLEGKAEQDSTVIKKAASETDRVMTAFRSFPETVDSRLAFDALSYAAHDIVASPSFSNKTVAFFWENALLDPLMIQGEKYAQAGNPNESTHLQIIKGLKRGIDGKGTGDMLVRIIPIVGPTPSTEIMEICREDSLVFRRIHDLIIYTRSLQQYGPPLWMTSGAWLMALELEGLPLSFFGFKPVIVDKALYLIFKGYNLGAVYAGAFDDPAPEDSVKMDAWLARASAVMNSLTIDDEFAKRVKTCSLSMFDAHNIFNDYLLITQADSVKKEFTIIIKRDRIRDNAFEFTGQDSLAVQFSTKQLVASDGVITRFAAVRVHGASMIGGRLIPGYRGEGTAYLMPMGEHNNDMIQTITKASMPEIKLNTR